MILEMGLMSPLVSFSARCVKPLDSTQCFPCGTFETTPEPGGTETRQTAIFDASGLFGLVYWYALYPLHRLVFAGMLRAIAARARESSV